MEQAPIAAGPLEASVREQFEAWIKAPPFEHLCDRKGSESAWPGNYKRYETQLAWEAYEEATDRCVKILERYPVPVGNSAAGEMACEWTIAALRELRDLMRPNALAQGRDACGASLAATGYASSDD